MDKDTITIESVFEDGLCTGCGTCVGICPLSAVAMVKSNSKGIYLPHLDYDQQRLGPDDPRIAGEVQALDALIGNLAAPLLKKDIEIIIIGEYDIQAVNKPVHINRILRQAGWLKVIQNATGELIDFGTSSAFAVADHQAAHVYVQDAAVLPGPAVQREESDRGPEVHVLVDAPAAQQVVEHLGDATPPPPPALPHCPPWPGPPCSPARSAPWSSSPERR